MTTTAAIPDSPPDWSLVDFHPTCPLCEYNLFGLGSPRCPECGYPFQWADVLDRRQHEHPYLFELHPERNISSYVSTVLKSIPIWDFWEELHPRLRPNLRRLMIYWSVGALFFLIAISMKCFLEWVADWATYGSSTTHWLLSAENLSEFAVQFNARGRRVLIHDALSSGLAPLLLPWLMCAALFIFRVSMRRAKVRPAHVFRSVFYSLDAAIWSLFAAALCLIFVLWVALYSGRHWKGHWMNWVVCLLLIVICFYRLVAAYRIYLRFDHPVATVLAASVIALLAYANICFFFDL